MKTQGTRSLIAVILAVGLVAVLLVSALNSNSQQLTMLLAGAFVSATGAAIAYFFRDGSDGT